MIIRPEQPSDQSEVHAINISAFETPAEADLVDALRAQADPVVSLVAECDGQVLGHILFSKVTLAGHPDIAIMGLAPMAVLSEHQRKGIGSALINAGIEACKQLGTAALVVLGHPGYYPKFGFVSSAQFGIKSDYEVPDDVFLAMELQPNALEGRSGTISYHSAFAEV
jgi:putative acetyltransferase